MHRSVLMIMKVKVWLKDGTILQNWTLTQSDIKVDGVAFQINTLDKIDSAYLYTLTGDKIYRQRVSGDIELRSPIAAGPLKVAVKQISDLNRVAARRKRQNPSYSGARRRSRRNHAKK